MNKDNDIRPIDPAVQKAANRLIVAYDELQRSQDPMVQTAQRGKVLEILEEAVDTTLASQMRRKLQKPQVFRN